MQIVSRKMIVKLTTEQNTHASRMVIDGLKTWTPDVAEDLVPLGDFVPALNQQMQLALERSRRTAANDRISLLLLVERQESYWIDIESRIWLSTFQTVLRVRNT